MRHPYGDNMLKAIAKGEVTAQQLPDLPSTNEIQFLHKQMFTCALPNAGMFRAGNKMVKIGAFPVAPPQRIPREFGLLEAQMKELPEDSVDGKALKLAFYHLRFEAIHPFPDGNGRVGRAISQAQAIRWLGAGREFSENLVSKQEQLAAYYAAFEASCPKGVGKGNLDIAPMANLFLKAAGINKAVARFRTPFRIPPFQTIDDYETENYLPPFQSELNASILTDSDKTPFQPQPTFESHGYER